MSEGIFTEIKNDLSCLEKVNIWKQDLIRIQDTFSEFRMKLPELKWWVTSRQKTSPSRIKMDLSQTYETCHNIGKRRFCNFLLGRFFK